MRLITLLACGWLLLVLSPLTATAEIQEEPTDEEEVILKIYANLASAVDQVRETEKEVVGILCRGYARRIQHQLRLAKEAQESEDYMKASDHLYTAALQAERLLNEGGDVFAELQTRVRGKAPSPYYFKGNLHFNTEQFVKRLARLAKAIRPTGFPKPGRKGEIDKLTFEFQQLSKDFPF